MITVHKCERCGCFYTTNVLDIPQLCNKCFNIIKQNKWVRGAQRAIKEDKERKGL